MNTPIRFNLSKIMKAAHTIRVKDGKSMSEALTRAWAWAKKKAADFLATKAGITCKLYEIVQQSEKALKVQFGISYEAGREGPLRGKFVNIWVPKSQVLSQTATTITIPAWLHEKKGHEMEMITKGMNRRVNNTILGSMRPEQA